MLSEFLMMVYEFYSFVFPSDSRKGFTAYHFHQYFETHT